MNGPRKKITWSCLDSKEIDSNPPSWFGGKNLIRLGQKTWILAPAQLKPALRLLKSSNPSRPLREAKQKDLGRILKLSSGLSIKSMCFTFYNALLYDYKVL